MRAFAEKLYSPHCVPTPCCETRFIGPTDPRGGRVKATNVNTKRSKTLPWDHALDVRENHARVAAMVLGSDELLSCGVDGGGYIFMVNYHA
jgi:hypothetical protein